MATVYHDKVGHLGSLGNETVAYTAQHPLFIRLCTLDCPKSTWHTLKYPWGSERLL